MSVFPESPKPQYIEIDEQEFRTIITPFRSGTEQRASLDRFPRRYIKLTWNGLLQADIDILWNFYRTCRGQYTSFYWFHTAVHNYDDEYVARGDGADLTFEMPSKTTTAGTLTVYVNSVSTGVTLNAGTGLNGEDQIVFTGAPASGALITADLDGKLKLKARFSDGKMSRELFTRNILRTGLALQEVR